MANAFLEIKNLTKKFGEVRALKDVSLQIKKGAILGLIGENGSGKSTISALIYGVYQPSGGEMLLKGKKYNPKSPLEARKNHISMIMQEKDTIDMLSVAENIFLGDESLFKKGGFIHTTKMNEEARKILKKVGLEDIDVTLPIVSFNFETRKLMEIARALYYQPELMIVDETTTALSHDGRKKIYEIMNEMKAEGKSVLFISHDLVELMDVCDELSVLRDGEYITTVKKENFSESEIKKTMVGRTLSENLYRTDFDKRLSDKVAIKVEDVSTKLLDKISFELHEGEILGIGGLSGCGMHEIGRILAGIDGVESGTVKVYNEELKGISHALQRKIGYISKDRDLETLILNETIQDNLTISAWDMLKKNKFFILPKRERQFANKQIEGLKIKCTSGNQLVRELSGGNKQKVSFGKLLGNESKILILDSPTRGVDIGVKTTMYELINDLKKKGNAIVIISEELSELIGMSDKILVLNNGRITGEIDRSESLRDVDVIDYMI